MKSQGIATEVLKALHSWLQDVGCDSLEVQELVNRYVFWKVSTKVDAMIARRERRGKPIQLQHKILKVFRDHLSITRYVVWRDTTWVPLDWRACKALSYINEEGVYATVTVDDRVWKVYKSRFPIPVAFSVEAYRELESLLLPYSKEEIDIALEKVFDIIDSWFGASVARKNYISFSFIAKKLVLNDDSYIEDIQKDKVESLVKQEMEALLQDNMDKEPQLVDIEKDTADREESKKDTSEVNEDSSKSGLEVHGGDHASGEVKDSANAYDKGKNNRQSSKPDFTKNWQKQVDKQIAKAFKKLKQQVRKQKQFDESELRNMLKENYGLTVKGAGGFSLACTFSFDDVQISEESKKYAKKLSDLIAQKAKAVLDIEGDTTPLLDAKKLAVEVASKRYNMSRCMKDGKTNDVVILMADVSGSCSAAAPATTAAITAVAMQNDNVMAIIHSNGWPSQLFFNGEYIDLVDSTWPTDYSLYDLLVKKYNIKMVIAFGDADALEAYDMLSSRCNLYWLDSYCASYGYGIGKKKQIAGALAERKSVHTAWGVNDVVSAYETLKILFKK